MKAVVLFTLGLVLILIWRVNYQETGSISERIERECRKSYELEGEQRVLRCRTEMTTRYNYEAERGKAETTFGRIR